MVEISVTAVIGHDSSSHLPTSISSRYLTSLADSRWRSQEFPQGRIEWRLYRSRYVYGDSRFRLFLIIGNVYLAAYEGEVLHGKDRSEARNDSSDQARVCS